MDIFAGISRDSSHEECRLLGLPRKSRPGGISNVGLKALVTLSPFFSCKHSLPSAFIRIYRHQLSSDLISIISCQFQLYDLTRLARRING